MRILRCSLALALLRYSLCCSPLRSFTLERSAERSKDHNKDTAVATKLRYTSDDDMLY